MTGYTYTLVLPQERPDDLLLAVETTARLLGNGWVLQEERWLRVNGLRQLFDIRTTNLEGPMTATLARFRREAERDWMRRR